MTIEKADSPPIFGEKIGVLRENIKKVIKGKDEVIDNCLCSLFSKGHVLIEDIPGTGKTTLAQAISVSTGLNFRRIQFTSDLLPSDILGVNMFDQQKREFVFKRGPIFSNIILADEINRTSPKTQSALLEAMNESHVTVDGVNYELPVPFLVIATQNPFEYQGTFPLPESQIDRFSIRIEMGYPDSKSEKKIVGRKSYNNGVENLKPVLTADDIVEIQNVVERVNVDDSILDYLLSIVEKTRDGNGFALGISTRGAITLKHLAQARAVLEGRNYCIPDDVKRMVVPAFAHRVVLKSSSNSEGYSEREALEDVLRKVAVPL